MSQEMSEFTCPKTGKLLKLTNNFWRFLVLDNFIELENLLDCECSVLDSFDDMVGGMSSQGGGIYITMGKLQEINQKINENRLETNIRTIKVMNNQQQVRFFVQGKGIMSSSLGIAVNWKEEKITGLIIIKKANESTFFIDDTVPVTSSKATREQVSMKPSEEQKTELLPPYLCPKPPSIPATVTVTVLSCSNLKSCMKRVVPRNVDAYVAVEVNGHERQTEVVTGANPWYFFLLIYIYKR